jgi:hypothetical protein
MARTRNQNERRDNRRWTADEDSRLLRHVKARPQNLHYCFLMVAEEIGRTDKAVAAHWYQVLSKKPEAMCFFTASPCHISKNRKNGMGVESNGNIWRRLMAVIRSLV